jgi:aminobenzoyl-glutamate utilization protein B
VLARTVLELLLRPELVEDAWRYFREEQTANQRYEPFIGQDDPPAIHLNRAIDAQFRPLLEPFYYQPNRYRSYLEQLGITYPTLRPDQWAQVREAMTAGEGGGR